MSKGKPKHIFLIFLLLAVFFTVNNYWPIKDIYTKALNANDPKGIWCYSIADEPSTKCFGIQGKERCEIEELMSKAINVTCLRCERKCYGFFTSSTGI